MANLLVPNLLQPFVTIPRESASGQPKTLANWASLGKGPKFRKPGGKVVLYTRTDLEAWVDGTCQ